ncbi:MAG: GldG family protein [Novosphingobium sp.]|nr:GldG family protein [Novosphingobium sp.]
MLGGEVAPHWARKAIERRRRLRPIDTLEPDTLGRSEDLLLLQPRPLSPQENVALDDWVAGGGRLLLFADPALTEDSAFALGDRRRPQDVVLLSPILARWGLALEFDDEQELGERMAGLGGEQALPVNLPGRFALLGGGRDDARCKIGAEGLVAECRIGEGRALAVADAALFEQAGAESAIAARRRALAALLARAFPR